MVMQPATAYVKSFLKAVNIATVFNDFFNTNFAIHETGQRNVRCPIHGGDSEQSMTLYYDTNTAYCWREKRSFTIINLVCEAEGGSEANALQRLQERYGLASLTVDEEQDLYSQTVYSDYVSAVHEHLRDTPAAMAALNARGLTAEDIEAYRIGCHPLGWKGLSPEQLESVGLAQRFGDRFVIPFEGAVILPCYLNKRLVGLQGWNYSGKNPKYLNPSHLHRSIIGTTGPVTLLVEGYFDMVSCQKAGYATLCSLSSHLTSTEIEFLQTQPPGSIVILYDGDEAGQQGAFELAKHLYPTARLADIRTVKDRQKLEPDMDETQFDPNALHVALGDERFTNALSDLVANAVDVFDFSLDELAHLEVSDTTIVNEKLTSLVRIIAQLPESQRDLPLERLLKVVKRFGVSREALKNQLTTIVKARTGRTNKHAIFIEFLIEQPRFELFKDKNSLGYASFERGGHREIHAIRSRAFTQYLYTTYYEHFGTEATPELIKNVVGPLEARATETTENIVLHNRTAPYEDAIYYDMTDTSWTVLKVSSAGVEHVTSTPLPLFQRHKHQEPQVMSGAREGDIFAIFDLWPMEDSGERLLLTVELVYNLIPLVPKTILYFQGESGSAKSTTSKSYRYLIDPAKPKSLRDPQTADKAVRQLDHHYVALYDNLYKLPHWLARVFTAAATGEGDEDRMLYTDDDVILRDYVRHVVLNSINKLGIEFEDFLDRIVLIRLYRLPDKQRITEDAFWQRFETLRPKVVGSMFKTLTRAMKLKVDGVSIESTVDLNFGKRMADWVEWGCYIAIALGHSPDEFLKAYKDNRALVNKELIQTNPVTLTLTEFLKQEPEGVYTATPTEAYERLTNVAEAFYINVRTPKQWPQGANALVRRLNELRSNLRAAGIEFEEREQRDETSHHKIITFRLTSPELLDDTTQPRDGNDNDEGRCATICPPATITQSDPSLDPATTDGENAGPPSSGPISSDTLLDLSEGNVSDTNIKAIGNVVAIDVETTGIHPQKHTMRLVAVADGTNVTSSEECTPIEGLLANPAIIKVFHNAAFDVPFFEAQGLTVVNYEDTMLMAQVLSNNEGDHDLASVAATYFNTTLDKSLQHPRHWHGDLTPQHRTYNRGDAAITRQLYVVLKQKLHDKGLDAVYQRELAALPVMIRLRKDGIVLDAAAWKADLAKHVTDRDELADRITAALTTPPDFNLNSPKHQLLPLLQRRGMPLRDTKERTLAQHSGRYPILREIIAYRRLNKLVTSYEKTYLSKVCPDGRIHASFRAIGTETGRMSCSSPNIQQVHGVLKPYFKAAAGYKYVIADYSQAQLRIIAEVSRDPAMVAAYQRGDDLHTNTAQALLNKEQVTNEDRQLAKGVNFGLAFGLTAVGLRADLKKKYDIDITETRAIQIRNRFFATYKGLAEWQNRQIKAEKISSPGGRVWEALPKPQTRRGSAAARRKDWTTRLNYPIQAAEAEGLKEALALLLRELVTHLKWRLVNIIHDSIMLEVPEMDAEVAEQILRDCMIKGMEHFVKVVPVEVDKMVSERWEK